MFLGKNDMSSKTVTQHNAKDTLYYNNPRKAVEI